MSAVCTGIRILDLSRLLPGPLATLFLADLGAEVIKVEPPGGEPTRALPPLVEGTGALFRLLNRSKRSLALDLKQARGREIFEALVPRCDVIVESFRPGVMQRLGLGYDRLRSLRADVVLCSLSGYGQQGPAREKPGHDINYCARAGLLAATGPRGGGPSVAGVPVADLAGTWQTVSAVLGALLQRERSGAGQHLDLSLADGALSSLAMPLSFLLAGLDAPPRGEGPLTGGLPGYGIFRTADGEHLALGALEPAFFDALCEALDLPELRGRAAEMGAPGQQLRERIAARIAERSLADWLVRLEGVDTCFEPVRSVADAVRDEHFAARGMFPRIDGPRAAQLLCPLRMRGIAPPETLAAAAVPELGEHTAEILTRELAMSAAELAQLVQQGVVTAAEGSCPSAS
ncbi:MAG: CoA transferase [Deltaproteobacteria bacterium]|nr:CoA transferase [Deltaproteobacteria bacterium]